MRTRRRRNNNTPPTPKAPAEPPVDTTTLDGWYVETYDCGGQKMNYTTIQIDGTKMYWNGLYIEYEDGEFNFTEMGPDDWGECDITVDFPNCNDGGNDWTMTTDSTGTWLKDITEPDWYGAFQKVTSPEKTGKGVGTLDLYGNGDDVFIGIMYRNNAYYLETSGWEGNLTKTGNTYTDDSYTITVDGSVATVSDSSDDDVPDGTYTLYTRSTPWPTVTAE